MNFSSYFVLSTLVVLGVMSHAYVVHEQFYPAVVYLSTDKMCLAIMYNFAFAMFLLFGKMLLKTFVGTLRDLEVEQLVDSGRGFLADTILFLVFYAPTIDDREVGTVYLIQYICCVIFMKVFHLTAQIRVSHMFEVGQLRTIDMVALASLMFLLLALDIVALQYFYHVASRSSTFFTWILFEALTMCTIVIVSLFKYSVHMVDLRLDNGWPGKSVVLFYIDLVHDVVSMTLFLVFMLTFFVQNPSRLPIYMMADVIQVARKLAQRLRSFRRYRRISTNMEARFADATDEEILNEKCVICREDLSEGSKPKKLPCGHIFHMDCLRSWLVMQQVCPTCRAEIPADGPLINTPPPAAVPEPQAAVAQPPAAAAAPAPTAAVPAAAAAAAPAAAAAQAAVAAAAANTAAAGTPAASSVPPAPGAYVSAASSALAAPAVAAATGLFSAQAASASATGTRMQGLSFDLGGTSAAFGTAASGLPPVQDILDALKRAEEVSKFLQDQQSYWMEQIKQIQQSKGQSFSANPTLGGLATSAPAGGSSCVSSATASAPAPTPSPASEAATASAAPAPAEGTSSEMPSVSLSSPQDQMAELRRRHRESWERKKSEGIQSPTEQSEPTSPVPPSQ